MAVIIASYLCKTPSWLGDERSNSRQRQSYLNVMTITDCLCYAPAINHMSHLNCRILTRIISLLLLNFLPLNSL